ncbi:MAG: glycoside hydrolase family 3 C-terminal domain-containing protein [Chloroflexota bacterium]
MKYKTIIDKMTLEDKVALCSGADFFNTKAFEKYGIPSITMVDGPHGVRKQVETADHLGINKSVPSTSFPAASLSACSWDRDLLREMGEAIGEEAMQEGISIVLGPGVNIKRNPLCGRNFEYFSEDPYLAGEIAASWIQGLQSKGVGASLKHFAANSQENERISSDSIVDERTLREIYLPAFERAVKNARPFTVMCAYNKVNGVYCSDNRYLLRDILRDEWGFDGVVVTDWGALNDRIQAFEAGLDLEMPGSKGHFDKEIIEAIRSEKLSEERLNESVDRLLDLIFTASKNRKAEYRYDMDAHHQLAKKIAANSAVLLKNDENILPIQKGKKIALIGSLAKEPRYQGAGSSHINPTKLSNAIDGFQALGVEFDYFDGYPLKGSGDEALLNEAVKGAKGCDAAVIFAGLPEEYESEGFDRESLAMPESHNELISKVSEMNPNTVVVLVGGSPVEMPWLSKVKAVLNMYLAGQAGGLAAAELLTGVVNPSGKLAESYPLCYEDVPSAGFYEAGGKQAQYREGIYVGYRYYDKAKKNVLFPFGYGLSYTTFEYSDLTLSHTELTAPYELNVTMTVCNTGKVDGAEVVQVYVSAIDSPVFRPEKELKEFAKVFLKMGESKQVSFTLDARAFAIYDVDTGDWRVPEGVYKVWVGAPSREVQLEAEVKVCGGQVEPREVPAWYRDPKGEVSQEDFEMLLGRKIESLKPRRKGEYTLDCTFNDMKESFIIRQVVKSIEKTVAKGFGGADYSNPTFKMIMSSSTNTPLKNLSQQSPDGMPKHVAKGLVHLANGNFIKGIMTFTQKPKEKRL